jgi:hypothetical protein
MTNTAVVTPGGLSEGDLQQLIQEGNNEELGTMFQNLTTSRKKLIVNKPMFFYEQNTKSSPFAGKLDFSLPIFVAASYGHNDIVATLIQNGADLHCTDNGGMNIIHALCWVGAYKPEQERQLCPVYRTIIASSRDKKLVLLSEDSDGLRPMDLACRLSTFRLMREIIETEGVYKTVIYKTPTYQRVAVDISVSNSNPNQAREPISPLYFIRYLTLDDIQKDGFLDFSRHPFGREILQNLLTANRQVPCLIGAFLFHVAFLTLFSLFDENSFESCTRNDSAKRSDLFNLINEIITPTTREILFNISMAIFVPHLLVVAVLAVYLAVKREAGSSPAIYQRPPALAAKHATAITGSYTFTVIFTLQFLVTFLYWILTIVNKYRPIPKETLVTIRILTVFNGVTTVFYFIQFFPRLGYLVIGILRCISTFVYFAVIYLLVFVGFAEAFRLLAILYCVEDIGYSYGAYYSTFLVMLNMVNLSNISNGTTPMPIVALHLTAVIVLVFMMLNLLIAVMNDTINNFRLHGETIELLIRLQGSYDMYRIQEQISRMMSILRRKPRPIKENHFVIEYEEVLF